MNKPHRLWAWPRNPCFVRVISSCMAFHRVVNAFNAAILPDADRSMDLDQACLGIDDLRWPAAQSFWITPVQNDAATSH